jgi:hypothetical protein
MAIRGDIPLGSRWRSWVGVLIAAALTCNPGLRGVFGFSSARLKSNAKNDVVDRDLKDFIKSREGLCVESAFRIRDSGTVDGWGVVAGEDVSKDCVLLKLPRSACLTFEDAARTCNPLASLSQRLQMQELRPGTQMHIKLALALLRQRACIMKGENEDVPPSYVESLPANPINPLFFDGHTVQLLQDVTIVDEVRRRCSVVKRAADLMSNLPGTDEDPFLGVRIDENALAWAMACVTSRAFFLGPSPALCPLLDMVNHSWSSNAEVRICDDYVELVTTTSISAGQEILCSYGPLSNDNMLLNYGFADRCNPFDKAFFKFDANRLNAARAIAGIQREGFGGFAGSSSSHTSTDGTEILPWQLSILRELKLAGSGPWYDAGSTSEEPDLLVWLGGSGDLIDPRLRAALRVLYSREGDIKGASLEQLMSTSFRISARNERRVMSTCVGLCASVMRAYGTSAGADEIALYGAASLGLSDDTALSMSSDTSGIDGTSVAWMRHIRDPLKNRAPEQSQTEEAMRRSRQPPKGDRTEVRLDPFNRAAVLVKQPGLGEHTVFPPPDPSLSPQMVQVLNFRICKKRCCQSTIASLCERVQTLGLVGSAEDVSPPRQMSVTGGDAEGGRRGASNPAVFDSASALGGGTPSEGSRGNMWFE